MSLEDLVSELRIELAGATSVIQGLQSSAQQQQAQIQSQNTELSRLQLQVASQQPVPDGSPQAAQPSSPTSPVGATLMPLVDTRTLGKPDTFNGDRSKLEFRDWSVVVGAYLGAVDHRFPEMLEKVETGVGSDFRNLRLTPIEKALSTQLLPVESRAAGSRENVHPGSCEQHDGLPRASTNRELRRNVLNALFKTILVRMCLDLRFYVTANKADIVEHVLDVWRIGSGQPAAATHRVFQKCRARPSAEDLWTEERLQAWLSQHSCYDW